MGLGSGGWATTGGAFEWNKTELLMLELWEGIPSTQQKYSGFDSENALGELNGQKEAGMAGMKGVTGTALGPWGLCF